jgi:hypothetical protein
MSQNPSIPQNPDRKPAEDFFELRRKGIGFIEEMGSRWWTDYNLHDPGITILEVLCYAITDLAYRTEWDMQDLLTGKDEKLREDQSFFRAKDIFTINPLTPNDYRKLLIDLPGVRNAWVQCKQCACEMPIYTWCAQNQIHWSFQKPDIAKHPYLRPKGLYDVLLLLEKNANKDVVIAAVKKSLQSHRNLDEDFCNIGVVPIEDIAICADVEVTPDADLERVQAEIWWQINQYLNPPVPTYSLEQLQEQHIPTEEIFNGPWLENGFIKTEDLEKSELRREIRTSDIINLLADIEGIRAVNNLLITKYDNTGQPIKGAADGGQNPQQLSAQWIMPVSAGHQAMFDKTKSRFLFYKNSFPFLPNQTEAEQLYEKIEVAVAQKAVESKDLPMPIGTHRDAEDYYPVQYSLPMTYGVGEEGLPSHVSDARKAQAKQLKAYLVLFEQILFNSHAQLAHVGDLFSSKTGITQTYFSKLIDKRLISESEELFDNLISTDLQNLIETPATGVVRRSRFLDHLLARFGENLNEYALVMHKQDGTKIPKEEVVEYKRAFLESQDVLGFGRFKAFDYQDNTGISGLQQRVQKLLGFDSNPDTFFVVEHLLLRPKFPGDALFTPCPEIGCEDCGPTDPYSFRLTFVMPGSEGVFNTDLELRHFADRTIRQETPSHLLPKICWVGNDGLDYDPAQCGSNEGVVIAKIADIIEKDLTQRKQACQCAEEIFAASYQKFKDWFHKNKHDVFVKGVLNTQLQSELGQVNISSIVCASGIGTDEQNQIKEIIAAYYADILVRGFQFDRFKSAWADWRKANAKIDWTVINLHQHLETLTGNCQCATEILEHYGQQFYDKMRQRFQDKTVPDATLLTDIDLNAPCTNSFDAAKRKAIKAALDAQYSNFLEVSYRLWRLIHVLENLENTYPVATLHDCADGNDTNPVRLGSTALGSN